MQFGGSPKCPRCNKAVYFNERVRVLGQDFHKDCFKCNNCEKRLELGKQREHDSQPYCVACHGKLFGPKGYGFGGGAGVLSDTGLDKDGKQVDYRVNKERVPASPTPSPRPSEAAPRKPVSVIGLSSGPLNECGKCGKTVGFAEKILAMNATFHKACFTCKECNKRLHSGEFTNHGADPYCKACHAKVHGPKGYGYGGAVLAANH